MESRSGNKPLNSVQMALLPMGFTPTNVHVMGLTGQKIKSLARKPRHPLTHRKRTPGRVLQIAPVYFRDEKGNFPVNAAGVEQRILMGYRQIWHRSPSRLMNI